MNPILTKILAIEGNYCYINLNEVVIVYKEGNHWLVMMSNGIYIRAYKSALPYQLMND